VSGCARDVNRRFRKVALIPAALGLGLAVLVAACGGSSDGTTTTPAPTVQTTSSTTSSPTPTAPTPTPTPARETTEIVVVGGVPKGGISRPRVTLGDRVRLIVRTDAGTELHLHGYDIDRMVDPGTPVRIDFKATIPGRFELELHDPDVLLAELTVTP
jgi:hypothetical protein